LQILCPPGARPVGLAPLRGNRLAVGSSYEQSITGGGIGHSLAAAPAGALQAW